MLLIIGSQDADPVTGEEDQGLMEAFMAYHKAARDAGVMVDSNVLDSFETATSVRVDRAGERFITDGPFAETREYLGGYYILDLPDLDTAIDWAAQGPGRGGSKCARSGSSACRDRRAGGRLRRGGVPGGAGPAAGHAGAPVR
jgi:hypothetical protein